MNANSLGLFAGSAFFAILTERHAGYQKNGLQIAEMAILLMTGILTFSRTFILTFPVVFFLFILLAGEKKSKGR